MHFCIGSVEFPSFGMAITNIKNVMAMAVFANSVDFIICILLTIIL
jgi:hypothetical protein